MKQFRSHRYQTYYRPKTRYVDSTRQPRRGAFRLGVVVFLLIMSGGVFLAIKHSLSSPADAQEAVVQKPPEKKLQPVDSVELSSQINAIITAHPELDMGVAIRDIKTGQAYTYGVENPFIAASVGKLLSATLYLHQVEIGQHTLDESIGGLSAQTQLDKMVAESDNTAWQAINDTLGHDTLLAYAHQLGLQSYSPTDNTIKPSEVAVLLDKLYQRKILNQDHTQLLLHSMDKDKEEMQFIRNSIDPAVNVYHKAGWLDDRAHDTAIVENGERPYVLVIFTKARGGDYNFENGQKIFQNLTQNIQNIFAPLAHS